MLDWIRGPKVDHPLADPKDARRIFDDIPPADAYKAIGEVNFWLDSVARTEGFRVDRRFELIDALDRIAKNHLRKLSLDYLPLRQQKFQENRVWSAMHEFCRLAGDGYLQCFEGFQAGGNGAGPLKSQVPAIVGRALRARTQQLKWALLRYGPVDGSVWGDFGRLYSFAESKGFAADSVAVYPGAHGESSARRELAKALMLAVSATDGLLPNEIEITERSVAFFARTYLLDASRTDMCTHCFDLAMRKPPARVRGSSAGASLRYFGGGPGIAELIRLIGVVQQEGVLPGDINLGGEYEPATVVKVWQHLVNQWSPSPPARSAERRATNARLTVVHGFDQLVSAIDPREEESLDFSGAGPAESVESESWVAEDASDSGYGAVVPALKGDWIKVGSLLGVRPEGSQHWGVGIVRRLARDGEQNLHVGIQVLARAGIPARVSPAGTVSSFNATRGEQPAVLLSNRPDDKQQVQVVLRMGSFGSAQSVEMRVRGKVFLLMPVRLVEGGEGCDVARFKVLERVS